MFRSNVLVCGGTGCTSSNSELIIQRLKEEIKAKGLEKEVNVVRTGSVSYTHLTLPTILRV